MKVISIPNFVWNKKILVLIQTPRTASIWKKRVHTSQRSVKKGLHQTCWHLLIKVFFIQTSFIYVILAPSIVSIQFLVSYKIFISTPSLLPSLTFISSYLIPSHPTHRVLIQIKVCSYKGFPSCKLSNKLIPFAHASFLLMQVIDPSTLIVNYFFYPIHLILFLISN